MMMQKERFSRPAQTGLAARVRPIFQDFHLLRMDGAHEYPAHRHENYEVILVETGPYRCALNGEELRLTKGQILVIKPGDWHQDHLRQGQVHYVLHFTLPESSGGGSAPHMFADTVRPAGQICSGDHTGERWLLEALRGEAEQAAPYAGAVQDSLLEVLFWKLIRDLPAASLNESLRRLPQDEASREAMGAVFRRFLLSNPVMPAIAAALKISPRSLNNECRRLFDLSPAQLLAKMKIERATELLRAGTLRVREVSDTLAFANPYHFSRVFRRWTGTAPSTLKPNAKTP